MKNNTIFNDLVIVELASVLAGPAVGLFFAELGAKVIKIENETTDGDVTRGWKLATEDQERSYSAYYCSVNWNKEVHLKNLRKEQDQAFVHNLVKDADIVISNFKKSSAKKLNMDYETLKGINPKLIYGQVDAYKYLNKPAFDVVLQAETGYLAMTGEPNGNPVKMSVALIDVITAHQLKEGLLVAMINRYKTGKGCFVETSLEASAIASLSNQASNYLMEGYIPVKMGLEHPNIVPYGNVFYTKDNIGLVTGAGTDHQFDVLCKSLKLEDICDDDRFSTNEHRVINRIELIEILAKRFNDFSFDEIYHILVENKVPVGKLNTLKDVFNSEVGKEMILEEQMYDGVYSRRVQSISFNITN